MFKGRFVDINFMYRSDDDKRLIHFVAEENNYRFPEDMKDKTVIDVGANIGSAALLAASRGAKVYAVEPIKSNFEVLESSVKLNEFGKNVKLYNKGIGEPGEAKMYTDDKRPDWSGLYADMNGLDPEKFEMVELITLKSIFDENKIEYCDYLKMDAEGAEYTIIDELEAGLHEKIGVIGCEIHDGLIPHLEMLARLEKFYTVADKRSEWEYILYHK